MKVILTAFNGLMRGEFEISGNPRPRIDLVMDQPAPRLLNVEDEFNPNLIMKRAVFELDSYLSFADEIGPHKIYYKMVNVS